MSALQHHPGPTPIRARVRHCCEPETRSFEMTLDSARSYAETISRRCPTEIHVTAIDLDHMEVWARGECQLRGTVAHVTKEIA
jgi:hypothetical protein